MVKETIAKFPIYESNLLSNKTEDIKLQVNDKNSMYLVHRSLVTQMAGKRQGSANSKTRSEVRGGGRKPWKQKGTGKARAGSTRSPLWRGGGVIFGPKPRDYSKKLNTKERRVAIQTVLLNKLNTTITIPAEELVLAKPSTKQLASKLKQLGITINSRVLLIVKEKNDYLYLASRNLPNVELVRAGNLNIASLLKARYLVVTRESLFNIQETYHVK
uniref:Large ribosomal subunit protein uL4c n=2 Tax=Palmaria TaxID=2821 RepID=A0A6C0W2K0_PALDE|nr:50S ribosomal protein L4 [Palmaria decipiens]QIC19537.1 50S ribosomal protein L4 [Palmaria decipiens]BBI37238.1 50S ribosomal protein L4 [Palmaria palmata]